jgi:GMP synthase-like glutamine amidotransferase
MEKKSLRIQCFQHVAFEGLGCINDWCLNQGHRVAYTRFYQGDPLPGTGDYDVLIVMGGPMGVYDDERYPWLIAEKQAIKSAIDQNKRVLGICLGAQLIALVLGARVFQNSEKEIGWFEVMMTQGGREEDLMHGVEISLPVFHWHGDTFELPQQARHLFYSKVCTNQAFVYNNHVLGLQFHFEVTAESLKAMIEHGRHELIPGNYIQTEDQILSGMGFIASNNRTMYQILENLVQGC